LNSAVGVVVAAVAVVVDLLCGPLTKSDLLKRFERIGQVKLRKSISMVYNLVYFDSPCYLRQERTTVYGPGKVPLCGGYTTHNF
jgi:hypothetical protein